MMGCARDTIIDKFLSAHKYRSLKMMKSFKQDIDAAINSRLTNNPSDLAVTPKALSVHSIRTFHQNIMVGLIEASKGIRDMFQENKSYKVFIPIEQNGEGFTMTLANAYDELQAMLGIVIPEYTQCILKPLREFFSHYDRVTLMKENGQLNSISSSSSSSTTTTSTITLESKENSSDNDDHDNNDNNNEKESTSNDALVNIVPLLEEERTVWITLTRQIILDCQYLDSGTEACRPPECDASLPHADGVAESILSALDQHFDKLYEKKMKLLQNSLLKSIPEFITASDCKTVCTLYSYILIYIFIHFY